jgi:hypothetical protein
MNTINLNRALFWDVNEDRIADVLKNSKDWVTLRVFEYGTLNEIFELIELYGAPAVKEILQRATRIKPVTRAMARLVLDLELR